MQLSGYISELLYENDCVIIPGFGGFVGNYSSAKIHPVNHTFYPPSKNILFNSKLTSDDGLLLHSVSIGENISYAEARSKTEKVIREWMDDLLNGKPIILEKIGKIRQDSDGRFLFDSDSGINYLESSFGFPAIISLPVQRTPAHKRLEKKFTDRVPRPALRKAAGKTLAFSSIVILAALIGWFAIRGTQKSNDAQQLSILNLKKSRGIVTSENLNESKILVKPLKELDFVNPEPKLSKLQSGLTDNGNDEALKVKPMHFIIGGAFKSRDNADKFLAQLIKKGYMASEAGMNPAGLIMISYFKSEDKSEALVNLDLVRQNDNPSAWLLTK